jgi:hypothetical protein
MTNTVVPEYAVTPVATVTAESELRAFAVEHGINLWVNSTPGAESSLSFGRDEDGGCILRVTADRPAADVLAFARTVIDRHETDQKVLAVAQALRSTSGGAPGFAELADAFLHATAWKLNGAGQFIKLIEATLTGMRQDTAA